MGCSVEMFGALSPEEVPAQGLLSHSVGNAKLLIHLADHCLSSPICIR